MAVAERADAVEQMVESRVARRSRSGRVHGAGMVAPLEQLPAGALQALDRRVVVFVLAEAAHRHAAQRSPHAFGRVVELALQPVGERLVEEPRRLPFGEHGERRVDARLDRPLAQQVGAEAVDGADVRFLEALHGALEARRAVAGRRRPRACSSCSRSRSFSSPAAFSVKVTATIWSMVARPVVDEPHDALHELGRLAGAGGGLDDQRRVERVGDERAVAGVGDRRASRHPPQRVEVGHGRLAAWCARGSSGPHTARKSQ